jgi:ethanolamine utilization microcompartment shell protein EutS
MIPQFDRTMLFCSACFLLFALAQYVGAFVFVGVVSSVGQALAQTVGGDVLLFVSGVALKGARS